MDGLLSQEEINALFNSTDDDTAEDKPAAAASNSDALTPEEKEFYTNQAKDSYMLSLWGLD